jgi:hypothetical protein
MRLVVCGGAASEYMRRREVEAPAVDAREACGAEALTWDSRGVAVSPVLALSTWWEGKTRGCMGGLA